MNWGICEVVGFKPNGDSQNDRSLDPDGDKFPVDCGICEFMIGRLIGDSQDDCSLTPDEDKFSVNWRI